MKNSEFGEDMSKPKKCKSRYINHIPLTKTSYFSRSLYVYFSFFDLNNAKLLQGMDKR